MYRHFCFRLVFFSRYFHSNVSWVSYQKVFLLPVCLSIFGSFYFRLFHMNDSMASVVWKLVTSLIRRQCSGIFKETSDVIHSHYRNSSYQQNSSGNTIYGLLEYHIWITGTLDYRNCVPVTGTVDALMCTMWATKADLTAWKSFMTPHLPVSIWA